MTRVLHLTRDFPPRINGGISTAVGGLVDATTRLGVTNAVVSFDAWRPRATSAAGPPTLDASHRAAVLRVSSPKHDTDLLAFAATQRPDVVVVHHPMLWDTGTRIPVRRRVFSVHVAAAHMDALRELAEPTLSARSEARALLEADCVVVPSASAATLYGAAVVAPLAVWDSDLARDVAAARHGQAILYVGRFGDVKGTRELLDAIPRVLAAEPMARFLVAGGLPDNRKSDARWRRRFEALGARVQLLGWLAPSELVAAYQSADVLVAPSWFETFGLAVLEGMLHGLAIVSTHGSAVAELVRHGQEGRLVPPRDVAALSMALLEARADAARMGACAAERARKHLWPDAAARWTDIYSAL